VIGSQSANISGVTDSSENRFELICTEYFGPRGPIAVASMSQLPADADLGSPSPGAIWEVNVMFIIHKEFHMSIKLLLCD
jgi:hypothetical protein